MLNNKKIKMGIAGACARGGHFEYGCNDAGIDIHAVCDINEENLELTAKKMGASEMYLNFEDMINKSDIDAVLIGTPMQFHVPQSMMALKKGKHVLCEVPAGVSLEECKKLVEVSKKSDAVYMLAENYIFTRVNMIITELVNKGLFGEIYYGEGEYLHELKQMNEDTPWRRLWQTGIAGITYGTHSIGPLLQWMPDDRIISVSCIDTLVRHKDPKGDVYAQMTPVMLCKTQKGGVIKIRVDMLSNRPHAMNNYCVQGINGSFESARAANEEDKIWFKELSKEVKWHSLKSLHDIDILTEKYLPKEWQNPSENLLKAKHGGGDYLIIQKFAETIRGEISNPIGIHEAMNMTLPGLLSQKSILNDGQWIDVPDSRTW